MSKLLFWRYRTRIQDRFLTRTRIRTLEESSQYFFFVQEKNNFLSFLCFCFSKKDLFLHSFFLCLFFFLRLKCRGPIIRDGVKECQDIRQERRAIGGLRVEGMSTYTSHNGCYSLLCANQSRVGGFLVVCIQSIRRKKTLLLIFSRSFMCDSLVAFATVIIIKRKPSAITHFTDINTDKLPFAGTGNSCGFPERVAGPATNQDYEFHRARKH